MGEKELPPDWAQELLNNSKAHGEQLEEYGDDIGKLSESMQTLQGDTENNFTRMGTEFGHLKERAAEDREAAERRAKDAQERADRKEKEMEGKVSDVHIRVNEFDKVGGEFKNHIEDDHATTANQCRTDLDNHTKDNNRHGGQAPGIGGTAKTVGLAGGSAGVIVIVYKLAEMFLAGGS